MSEANVPATQTANVNYFESYGATASMNSITGTLIKFSKGDWVMGQEEEEVPAGMEFVCDMMQFNIGWTKWVDNKPVAQHMGKLVEGFTPPRRPDLGDMDEELWETDDRGTVRDPWQFTNTVILRKPGKSAADDANLFTFSTSSKGGINAMGDLCKAFARMIKEKAEGLPIITLQTTSYKHPVYGKVKKPEFKIVGWEATPPQAPAEEPKKVEAPKAAAKKTK